LPVELLPSGESSPSLPFQSNENPFCQLMVQFKESCAACQQVHQQLGQRIAGSLVPETICCSVGLVEFAVPIVINGQHVANLLGGRVFPHKPNPAQFDQLARRLEAWGLHAELDQFKTRFFQMRVMSRKQFQASVQMLALFAKLLAEDVNRSLLTVQTHDGLCSTIAKNFILTHMSEPLHLRDVAEHVHVSTPYFCKCFKRETGMGFSEFLGRARVQNAKQALANSVLSISEVAAQAGFGSLSQFNRTFRRYVGCSPKEYRASLL
jgi:AraC-like DNA-binding protein/ligand-binding sensor protein